jgi:hypothetical protein
MPMKPGIFLFRVSVTYVRSAPYICTTCQRDPASSFFYLCYCCRSYNNRVPRIRTNFKNPLASPVQIPCRFCFSLYECVYAHPHPFRLDSRQSHFCCCKYFLTYFPLTNKGIHYFPANLEFSIFIYNYAISHIFVYHF